MIITSQYALPPLNAHLRMGNAVNYLLALFFFYISRSHFHRAMVFSSHFKGSLHSIFKHVVLLLNPTSRGCPTNRCLPGKSPKTEVSGKERNLLFNGKFV